MRRPIRPVLFIGIVTPRQLRATFLGFVGFVPGFVEDRQLLRPFDRAEVFEAQLGLAERFGSIWQWYAPFKLFIPVGYDVELSHLRVIILRLQYEESLAIWRVPRLVFFQIPVLMPTSLSPIRPTGCEWRVCLRSEPGRYPQSCRAA